MSVANTFGISIIMNKVDFVFDSGKNVFFTSDTHFNHANIIKHCDRPFSSVDEMNEVIINNWNSVVKTNDIVFHLGDFAFGGVGVWQTIRGRLNGKIIIIKGNHDNQNWSSSFNALFSEISRCLLVRIENQLIYLTHFPLLCFDGDANYDTWNLYGHVHTRPNAESRDLERVRTLCYPTQYDVGVDNNHFAPVSFYQVRDVINKRMDMVKNNH